jgi:hypothetical protein
MVSSSSPPPLTVSRDSQKFWDMLLLAKLSSLRIATLKLLDIALKMMLKLVCPSEGSADSGQQVAGCARAQLSPSEGVATACGRLGVGRLRLGVGARIYNAVCVL